MEGLICNITETFGFDHFFCFTNTHITTSSVAVIDEGKVKLSVRLSIVVICNLKKKEKRQLITEV